MARFLIFGKQTDERYGLALMLEFAGHQCAMATTLEEAVEMVQKEDYQLVLGDSPQGGQSLQESVRALRGVAPKVQVMFLTEEVAPRLKQDEVVSGPQPAGGNVGAPILVAERSRFSPSARAGQLPLPIPRIPPSFQPRGRASTSRTA